MSFAKDLNAFNAKFKDKTVDFITGVEIAISNEVIERTPVDTGRARANWFPSVNRPSLSKTEQQDKGGAKAKRRVFSLARPKKGRKYYLVNNLPYIEVLEYGSSKQAPSGMVRITVARFKKIINEQLRRVK
jgi:hypothetical protein